MTKAISVSEIEQRDYSSMIDYFNLFIRKNQHQLYLGSILVPVESGMLLRYDLYNNDFNCHMICEPFENEGWSVRYGLQICWVGYQGMRSYFFEFSKDIKFTHRKAQDYNKEIKRGEN